MSETNDLNAYVKNISNQYTDELKIIHMNAQSLHNSDTFLNFLSCLEVVE